jgi:hypothetical protein
VAGVGLNRALEEWSAICEPAMTTAATGEPSSAPFVTGLRDQVVAELDKSFAFLKASMQGMSDARRDASRRPSP